MFEHEEKQLEICYCISQIFSRCFKTIILDEKQGSANEDEFFERINYAVNELDLIVSASDTYRKK